MELLGFGKSKLPSIIKNPFSKSKVYCITVDFSDYWDNGQWKATGSVRFKNGNTKGEQRFEADTFDEVVLQIKKMIENL